jgi:hypothetical protein
MNIIKFFDEINALDKGRRRKRIRLAQKMEQYLLEFFRGIFDDIKYGYFLHTKSEDIYIHELCELLIMAYLTFFDEDENEIAITEVSAEDSKLRNHLYQASEQIMKTTIDAYLEPEAGTEFDLLRATGQPIAESDIPESIIKSLGRERIQLIAANESLYINNYMEQKEAIAEGKRFKVWNTMEDERVRPTHQMVDQKEIPINEPFTVGVSLMMFPGDTSMNAEASEIIMCRCFLTYK